MFTFLLLFGSGVSAPVLSSLTASIFSLGVAVALGVAQPVPFADIAQEIHPPAYYQQQTELWASRAQDACHTPYDWFNYLRYARYANKFAGTDYDLKAILVAAEERVPEETFELNYMRYVVVDDQAAKANYLQAAHRIAPERPEAYPALITNATLSGDFEFRDSLLHWKEQRAPYPPSLVDYNYNTLQSVTENGILLSFGDADTYPIWLLQSVYEIRPDVLVGNHYLLSTQEKYRNEFYKRAGITEADITDDIVATLATSARPLHLVATGGNRIAAMTVPGFQLYNVGLTFRLSDYGLDNLKENDRLFQRVWRLDYLRSPLRNDPQSRVAAQLSANYLAPLIELKNHHRETNFRPDTELDELVTALATRTGRSQQVTSLLADIKPADPRLASNASGLTAKDIFSRFHQSYTDRRRFQRRWEEQLHGYFMQDTEVSNADYQLFLEDLLRQRNFSFLDSAAVEEGDWVALLPDSVRTLPESELYESGRPTNPNHPITNISHRAAQLYAIWLTQVYNQDGDRKDPRTVRFRLPTAGEHELAARAGKEHAPYPWGGPYYRNSKGCLLANLNTLLLADNWSQGDYLGVTEKKQTSTSRSSPDCGGDGSLLTVPVDAFYPNDFGLYNMSGNAAEMTDVPGQTVGGSWVDGPEALCIGIITNRKLPSPTTGFRLVMEFVDE